jgi:hypothetical protein
LDPSESLSDIVLGQEEDEDTSESPSGEEEPVNYILSKILNYYHIEKFRSIMLYKCVNQ